MAQRQPVPGIGQQSILQPTARPRDVFQVPSVPEPATGAIDLAPLVAQFADLARQVVQPRLEAKKAKDKLTAKRAGLDQEITDGFAATQRLFPNDPEKRVKAGRKYLADHKITDPLLQDDALISMGEHAAVSVFSNLRGKVKNGDYGTIGPSGEDAFANDFNAAVAAFQASPIAQSPGVFKAFQDSADAFREDASQINSAFAAQRVTDAHRLSFENNITNGTEFSRGLVDLASTDPATVAEVQRGTTITVKDAAQNPNLDVIASIGNSARDAYKQLPDNESRDRFLTNLFDITVLGGQGFGGKGKPDNRLAAVYRELEDDQAARLAQESSHKRANQDNQLAFVGAKLSAAGAQALKTVPGGASADEAPDAVRAAVQAALEADPTQGGIDPSDYSALDTDQIKTLVDRVVQSTITGAAKDSEELASVSDNGMRDRAINIAVQGDYTGALVESSNIENGALRNTVTSQILALRENRDVNSLRSVNEVGRDINDLSRAVEGLGDDMQSSVVSLQGEYDNGLAGIAALPQEEQPAATNALLGEIRRKKADLAQKSADLTVDRARLNRIVADSDAEFKDRENALAELKDKFPDDAADARKTIDADRNKSNKLVQTRTKLSEAVMTNAVVPGLTKDRLVALGVTDVSKVQLEARGFVREVIAEKTKEVTEPAAIEAFMEDPAFLADVRTEVFKRLNLKEPETPPTPEEEAALTQAQDITLALLSSQGDPSSATATFPSIKATIDRATGVSLDTDSEVNEPIRVPLLNLGFNRRSGAQTLSDIEGALGSFATTLGTDKESLSTISAAALTGIPENIGPDLSSVRIRALDAAGFVSDDIENVLVVQPGLQGALSFDRLNALALRAAEGKEATETVDLSDGVTAIITVRARRPFADLGPANIQSLKGKAVSVVISYPIPEDFTFGPLLTVPDRPWEDISAAAKTNFKRLAFPSGVPTEERDVIRIYNAARKNGDLN